MTKMRASFHCASTILVSTSNHTTIGFKPIWSEVKCFCFSWNNSPFFMIELKTTIFFGFAVFLFSPFYATNFISSSNEPFLFNKLKWVVYKLFFVRKRCRIFLKKFFIFMIFKKKYIYFYELVSNLLTKGIIKWLWFSILNISFKKNLNLKRLSENLCLYQTHPKSYSLVNCIGTWVC